MCIRDRARALVLEPDLLLMDEPFSALDIGLKAQLHRLLLDHQAARKVAVLMITHDLMEAVRLADTVLVIASEPGRIAQRFELGLPAMQRDDGFVHRGTADILQVPVVRKCFGLEALPAEAAQSTTARVGAGATVIALETSRPAGKKGIAC